MIKNITFEGKEYNVKIENGIDNWMYVNDVLIIQVGYDLTLELFKEYSVKAILKYEEKMLSKKNISEWNGTFTDDEELNLKIKNK